LNELLDRFWLAFYEILAIIYMEVERSSAIRARESTALAEHTINHSTLLRRASGETESGTIRADPPNPQRYGDGDSFFANKSHLLYLYEIDFIY
jgi:hypothetical protein